MSKKSKKKYDALSDRIHEENPEIGKELTAFFEEIEEMWKKISPFIGEEEAYGKWAYVFPII